MEKTSQQLPNFLLKSDYPEITLIALETEHCTVAHRCKCSKILIVDGTVVCEIKAELQSNQEEADSRILLHSKHAVGNGKQTVIITVSPRILMYLC